MSANGMPSSSEIAELHAKVLDHLLISGHAREILVKTLPDDKKWQMVQMHRHVIDSSKLAEWGDKENALLLSLQKAKSVDIKTLLQLKSILGTANRESLSAFLKANGVQVIVKCINERLGRASMNEIDISVLFELTSCCKAFMNNSTGMDGFLAYPEAIDAIVRCLLFDWKALCLQVLEILSVSCYYSSIATKRIVESIRRQCSNNLEHPFASFSQALHNQDIQFKYAIVQFLNNAILGLEDLNDRVVLRASLKKQQIVENLNGAIDSVDRELEELQKHLQGGEGGGGGGGAQASSAMSMQDVKVAEFKKTLVCFCGPKAVEHAMEQRSDGKRNVNPMLIEPGSSAAINPLQGQMAGRCMAAKNSGRQIQKRASIMVGMLGVGVKSTKSRWYELDGENFKWCAGHEREGEFKGVIPIATVIDTRNFSTDSNLRDCKFAFEIQTAERTFAMGCEAAVDKENWITALSVAKDKVLFNRNEYKLPAHELSLLEVMTHLDNLKKQKSVFDSIAAADQSLSMTAQGLDTADLAQLSRFVQLECLAAGTEDQLHLLLQELLLVPPHARSVWQALADTVFRHKRAAAGSAEGEGSGYDSSEATVAATIVAQVVDKHAEVGQAYVQMSKLALAVVAAETECRRLAALQLTSGQSNNSSSASAIQQQASSSSYQESSELHGEINKLTNEIVLLKSQLDELRLQSTCQSNQQSSSAAAAIASATTAVYSESSSPSSSSAASSAGDDTPNKFAKYEKMKKMLPEGAIRQKMAMDSLTPEEIDSFFDGSYVNNLAVATAAVPQVATIEASPVVVVNEKFVKYEKMKKMLPEGAIRQKMAMDSLTPEEIDSFFDGSYLTASSATTASVGAPVVVVVNEKFVKYEKMKKMLPEGAIRQKMAMDNLTPAEIDSFFDGSYLTASTTAPIDNVVNEKFLKYEKMRKMLPEGAIRQKMAMDNLTPAEIDSFFDGSYATSGSAPAVPPAVVDERLEKYEKMKKMLPEGAIRQKMAMDKFSPAEIDKFFGVASSSTASSSASSAVTKPKAAIVLPPKEDPVPEGMRAKPKIQPTQKLKGLFWNKLKSTEIKNTIWQGAEDLQLDTSRLNQLEELFSNAPAKAIVKPVGDGGGGGVGKPKVVALLDGKKTQNVLIAMGKIRQPAVRIVELIAQLKEAELTASLTETLLSIIPTAEELTAVKAHDNPDTLDQASSFFRLLSVIPRIDQRLNCHFICFKWMPDSDSALVQVNVLRSACREIQSAQHHISRILSIVLSVGNYLNGGTARGQAYGVKLEVLKKLATVKANNVQQGTLVHFIALEAVGRFPDLISFADDWTALWASAEVSPKQVQGDVKALEQQMSQLKAELASVSKQLTGAAGMSAAERTVAEALKRRLESFIASAEPQLVLVQQSFRSTTEEITAHMARYQEGAAVGESELDAVKTFLDTCADFVKSFKQAAEDNKKRQAEEEKQAKKDKEAADKAKRSAGGGGSGGALSPSSTGRSSAALAGALTASLAAAAAAKAKDKDNLFGNFHSSQSASPDAVVAQFKLKMQRKELQQQQT